MTRFERLRALMDRLRDPGGCPWDRKQTLADLRSYVLEEAYEVVEAIDLGDHDGLREELGDLLLQVLFIARVESEEDRFDVDDVITAIHDKLVRRHPHIFGDARAESADEVLRQWEQIKRDERADPERSALDGVPRALPALLRAGRLSTKAALTGFDWSHDDDLAAKLREEVEEFLQETPGDDREAMEREMGDILFVLANFARRWGVDPEAALQRTSDRFVSRFGHIEAVLRRQGKKLEETSLDEMEALWQEAKGLEKT